MAAKKTCVACAKLIPDVAPVCVFCSSRQPASPDAAEAGSDASASTLAHTAALAHGHATDPTLVGLKVADLEGLWRAAAAAEAAAEPAQAKAAAPGEGANAGDAGAANGSPPEQLRPTAVHAVVPAPVASDDELYPEPRPAARAPVARPAPLAPAAVTVDDEPPWSSLGRLVMGIGGAVLVALFFLPWHGVTSWRLLETLAGADFARQLFYLTGGVVLLASALLPLPFVFRAVVGTLVAATPVVLGAHAVLGGWRGVLAALALLALPATHLVRARPESARAGRLLVLAVVAAVALLYLLPTARMVPIAAVVRMLGSGSPALVMLGALVLLPLAFAGLSLVGALGRELADVGVLLSVLILLWSPLVVALRGFILDDSTQVYVAVALLWASATAALSLAQLLTLAAPAHTVARPS